MKVLKMLPGIGLAVGVAAVACFIESLLPIHIIGSAVIAMFIGMLLNYFLSGTNVFATGLKFTSKKILKFAIILLGLIQKKRNTRIIRLLRSPALLIWKI